MSRKNKNKIGHVTFNGGSNNSNNQTQVKSGNQINKGDEIKIINNHFSHDDYYNKSVEMYDSVDRIGIYNRVDEIITCEAIFLNQTREVKGKEYNIVANVIEDGKLISDHLHVNFGDYYPASNRLLLTGEVYAYGQDNNKRGVNLIEEPTTLTDTFRIFNKPYDYIDITQRDFEQTNMYLNQMDNYTISQLINKLRNVLNNLSRSRLGEDTIFNYILTQMTLNANNQLIYSNKLDKFKKPALVFIVLTLSSVIYDLTTLIDNEDYFYRVDEDYAFAEINILDLFKDISIKCNCIQGLNGFRHCKKPNNLFKSFCDYLDIKPNLAYAHTAKHRYTNFEITEEDEYNLMNDKSFYAVILKFMF